MTYTCLEGHRFPDNTSSWNTTCLAPSGDDKWGNWSSVDPPACEGNEPGLVIDWRTGFGKKYKVLKIEIAVQISFNLYFNCLLPPANEVWDKVMFLDLSLFTGVCLRGGGCIQEEEDLQPGRGVCIQGKGVCIQGVLGDPQLENKVVMFLHLSVCSRGGSASGGSASGRGSASRRSASGGPSSRGGVCIQGTGRLYPEGLGSPPEIEKECLLVTKAVTWIQKAYAKTQKYLGSIWKSTCNSY